MFRSHQSEPVPSLDGCRPCGAGRDIDVIHGGRCASGSSHVSTCERVFLKVASQIHDCALERLAAFLGSLSPDREQVWHVDRCDRAERRVLARRRG